jgi:hypothetical protein
MQMLYNSDNYVVVQIDVSDALPASQDALQDVQDARGGYEIVDKFARKEIFIQGALARSFKEGVEALIRGEPTEEAIDAYIERYASLMQQPVVLH